MQQGSRVLTEDPGALQISPLDFPPSNQLLLGAGDSGSHANLVPTSIAGVVLVVPASKNKRVQQMSHPCLRIILMAVSPDEAKQLDWDGGGFSLPTKRAALGLWTYVVQGNKSVADPQQRHLQTLPGSHRGWRKRHQFSLCIRRNYGNRACLIPGQGCKQPIYIRG